MLVWLRQIPEELIHAGPWLCIFYSWALIFAGQTSKGEEYLLLAENTLSSSAETADPDRTRQLGHTAAARAYLAMMSQDVAGISRYIDAALQFLPADDLSVRSLVECLLGGSKLLIDDLDLAEEAYTNGARLASEAGNSWIAVSALCALATLCQARGELHRAFEFYEKATNLAVNQRGQAFPVVGEIYAGRAGLHYEWNDLKSAEEDSLAARKVGKLYSPFDLTVDSVISLSRVRLAQGDPNAAEELLKEVEQDDRQASLRPSVYLLAQKMALYQTIGDLAKVSRLVEQHEWKPDACLYAWGAAFIAYARFLMAKDEPLQANDWLEECLARPQACVLRMFRIKALVLQASVLGSQGKLSLAQAKMELALSLA
jgi:LuxR family maltose regulon positive regulatory protein